MSNAIVATPEGRSEWRDVAPFVLCVLVGTVLAVMPNLVWWERAGGPYCTYDEDDITVTTAYASTAFFHGSSGFTDPYSLTNDRNHHPPLIFIPFALGARALGLNALGIGFLWRLFSGFALSATLYMVIRQYLGRPWLASALVLFLVSDSGNFPRQLLFRHALLFYESVVGPASGLPKWFWTPGGGGHPELLPHFRLTNPGVTLPFVWFHLFFLIRARERPTVGRLIASGLSFGLLFYVYFYYWTAVGVALLMGCLVDVGRRRAYFATGCIGLVAGIPSLLDSMSLKAGAHPDWGVRNAYFNPIGRTAALSIPKVAMVLMLPTLPWAWSRFRELLPIAMIAFATMLLRNHNVLTKFDTANYHWEWMLQGQAMALYLILFVAAVVLRYVRFGRRGVVSLWVLLAIYVGMGCTIRVHHAMSAPVASMTVYLDYMARKQAPGAVALEPNSVVAGPYDFQKFAAILDDERPLSSIYLALTRGMSNEEQDARIALDCVLSGVKRPDIGEKLSTFLPYSPERRAVLDQVYDRTLADPEPVVNRFRVRYIAVRAGQPTPPYLAQNARWKVIQDGPIYVIWERKS